MSRKHKRTPDKIENAAGMYPWAVEIVRKRFTYWPYDRLWAFIGVSYEVVPAALQRVSQEFSQRLIGGLRSLLLAIETSGPFADTTQKAKG